MRHLRLCRTMRRGHRAGVLSLGSPGCVQAPSACANGGPRVLTRPAFFLRAGREASRVRASGEAAALLRDVERQGSRFFEMPSVGGSCDVHM